MSAPGLTFWDAEDFLSGTGRGMGHWGLEGGLGQERAGRGLREGGQGGGATFGWQRGKVRAKEGFCDTESCICSGVEVSRERGACRCQRGWGEMGQDGGCLEGTEGLPCGGDLHPCLVGSLRCGIHLAAVYVHIYTCACLRVPLGVGSHFSASPLRPPPYFHSLKGCPLKDS